jgi:hypothetical protein
MTWLDSEIKERINNLEEFANQTVSRFVLRDPSGPKNGGNVFYPTEMAELCAAAATVQGIKSVQIDARFGIPYIGAPPLLLSGNGGAGTGSFATTGTTVTFTLPAAPSPAFVPALVGYVIRIQGSLSPENDGEYIITGVPAANQITFFLPKGGITDELFPAAGTWIAGGWNCENWELTAHTEGVGPQGPFIGLFWGFDLPSSTPVDMFLGKLRKIGAELFILNATPTVAPLALFDNDFFVELGTGHTGDYPFIETFLGAASIDVSSATDRTVIRMRAIIGGLIPGVSPPSIFCGASPAVTELVMFDFARLYTDQIDNTNAASTLRWSITGTGSRPTRQSLFAGSLDFPNAESQGANAHARLNVFPASVNQAEIVPFTSATGPAVLVMNGSYLYDTTAGPDAVTALPLIRAAAPTANIIEGEVGILESTGLQVIVTNQGSANDVMVAASNVAGTGDSFAVALGVVTLTDAAGDFTADMVGKSIVIAGSTNPLNDGTFVVASFIDASNITYANAVGVAEAFPGTWTVYMNTVMGGTTDTTVGPASSAMFISDGVNNWRRFQ